MISRLGWELVDLTTDHVQSGERELRMADFEVMLTPAPPTAAAGPAADKTAAGGRRRGQLADHRWPRVDGAASTIATAITEAL